MRVTNKLPAFGASAKQVLNDAMRSTAADILIKAKDRAPFKDGGLRGESDTHMTSLLSWRISFWIEYARFQELGGDSTRRVRKYTTSGTGKHFLKTSGDEGVAKLNTQFVIHGRRARA